MIPLNHAYFYVVVELVVDVLKNEDKKRTHLFQKYQFNPNLYFNPPIFNMLRFTEIYHI